MHQPRKQIAARLTESGCFEVTSHSLHTNGYPVAYLPYYTPEGLKRISKKQMCIHRYVWSLHHGPIPEGSLIMHTCDNRLCINPSHLILGTHLDNMADKVNKNRHAKGDTCGRAKISSNAVRSILQDTGHTQQELSELFNISRSQISRIKAGRTWKHVHA